MLNTCNADELACMRARVQRYAITAAHGDTAKGGPNFGHETFFTSKVLLGDDAAWVSVGGACYRQHLLCSSSRSRRAVLC